MEEENCDGKEKNTQNEGVNFSRHSNKSCELQPFTVMATCVSRYYSLSLNDIFLFSQRVSSFVIRFLGNLK